jgi:hypothetical protein
MKSGMKFETNSMAGINEIYKVCIFILADAMPFIWIYNYYKLTDFIKMSTFL